MIEIKGYVVGNPGGSEVGINPQWYEIKGDFYFKDENNQAEFEKLLLKTFELICNSVFIYTFEDIETIEGLKDLIS